MPVVEEHRQRGRRWGVVFGAGYLVFLIGPFVGELTSKRPVATIAAVCAAVAVFVAIDLAYWWFLSYERELPRQSIAVMLALNAIALGLTLHDANWEWCYVYCGVAAGASSWDRRWSGALVGAVLAQVLVLGLLVPATHDFLPSLVVIVLMGGLGMVGIGRMIESNFQLRQAREEVGRLAVAEERLRFARDLHDLLGHSLSVIVLKSELAGRLGATDPERATAEIRDVERVAREALREVRDAVAGYRQLGLSQEMESAQATLSAAGIEARVHAVAGALPTPVDSTLAWALREGVTNVLRHSRARRAEVRIVRSDDRAELELLDDGVGCHDCGDGNGLRGLRERVAAHDGRLEAGPRAGGGFRLAVSLPLHGTPQRIAVAPA
jgi:two-component system sensor histidine kinase DesK